MAKFSEQVHQLIHSLSASEKAHFKKLNKSSVPNKLTSAFDILNAHPTFNRTEIDVEFAAKRISKGIIFGQLFSSIRRSLSLYHSEKSVTLTLNELINSLEILFQKNQRELCLRLIEKGIELSEQQDMYEYTIMFRSWFLKLERQEQPIVSDVARDNYAKILDEIEHLKVMRQYDRLRNELMGLTRLETTDAKVRKFVVEKVLEHPILHENRQDNLTNSQTRELILIGANYLVGRWEEALQAGLNLLNTTPDFAELTAKHAIGNRFANLINIGKLQQLTYRGQESKLTLQLIEDAHEFKDSLAEKARGNAEFLTKDLIITDLLLSGQLNVALDQCFDMLENSPSQYKVRLRPIEWSIPLIYFLQTEYSKALAYLNTEFLTSDFTYMNDIGKWLELLCLFMKRDDEALFESRWRSMNRQIKKENSGYHWEQAILETLKRGFGRQDEIIQSLMSELNESLNSQQNELRTSVPGAFDFILWTESLAIGKPMAIMMKYRYLGITH